jgi:hypothetical protein
MQKQSGIIIQGNELKKHGYYFLFSVSDSWHLHVSTIFSIFSSYFVAFFYLIMQSFWQIC